MMERKLAKQRLDEKYKARTNFWDKVLHKMDSSYASGGCYYRVIYKPGIMELLGFIFA
jgi:hypothetical protein